MTVGTCANIAGALGDHGSFGSTKPFLSGRHIGLPGPPAVLATPRTSSCIGSVASFSASAGAKVHGRQEGRRALHGLRRRHRLPDAHFGHRNRSARSLNGTGRPHPAWLLGWIPSAPAGLGRRSSRSPHPLRTPRCCHEPSEARPPVRAFPDWRRRRPAAQAHPDTRSRRLLSRRRRSARSFRRLCPLVTPSIPGSEVSLTVVAPSTARSPTASMSLRHRSA